MLRDIGYANTTLCGPINTTRSTISNNGAGIVGGVTTVKESVIENNAGTGSPAAYCA